MQVCKYPSIHPPPTAQVLSADARIYLFRNFLSEGKRCESGEALTRL